MFKEKTRLVVPYFHFPASVIFFMLRPHLQLNIQAYFISTSEGYTSQVCMINNADNFEHTVFTCTQ